MKIALLGASHWHAPCYHNPAREMGHDILLLDEDIEKIRPVAERFAYECSDDYGRLDRDRPDFAVCLGEHWRMPEYTRMCIDKGIPFLAEKPAGLTADIVESLADEADRNGVFQSAALALRMDHPVARIADILKSGRLGRVGRLGLTYFAGPAHRYIKWKNSWVLRKDRAGGGWPYNLGVHLLDMLHFWGFDLDFVAGTRSQTLNQGEIEDLCTMLIRTGGDSYAVVEGGYCATSAFGGYALSVFAEKGNIDYRWGTLRVSPADEEEEVTELGTGDSRARLLEIVLQQSQTGKRAPVDLRDVARTVRVIEAYYRACPQ